MTMDLPSGPLWPCNIRSRSALTQSPRSKFSAAVVCWSGFACLVGCASTVPYDPDHLGAAQIARISDICQTTMGLSPKESPVLGIYLGSPHLDREVSHYEVCIASLSDSLLSVAQEEAASKAHQECLAKGLPLGSADLAVCVLERVKVNSVMSSASDSSQAVRSENSAYEPRAVRSFFYASPRETRRREEKACARLGLEPPYGAFAKCVKLLNDNFYAIDNPVS